MKKGLVIVNFGGPRSLNEVRSFLEELLCDRDVVRSYLPQKLHNLLFKAIAYFRTKKIQKEYEHIGSKSPIWADTEWVAEAMRPHFSGPVITFHRYLKQTHTDFLDAIKRMHGLDEIIIFPLFAQFSYATTGSIARWMQTHLESSLLHKLRWIRSYCNHPAFINSYAQKIRDFAVDNNIDFSKTAALVSFHGIPQAFVNKGDCYQKECNSSFEALKKQFPELQFKLSYQSKFGPGQWLQPSTAMISQDPQAWTDRPNVLIIPLAFTSDHIETLAEIENEYLPPLRKAGLKAWRLEALNRSSHWLEAIKIIVDEALERPWGLTPNSMLVASYCPAPNLCLRFGLCGCIKK
jgi:ferrochelatase